MSMTTSPSAKQFLAPSGSWESQAFRYRAFRRRMASRSSRRWTRWRNSSSSLIALLPSLSATNDGTGDLRRLPEKGPIRGRLAAVDVGHAELLGELGRVP